MTPQNDSMRMSRKNDNLNQNGQTYLVEFYDSRKSKKKNSLGKLWLDSKKKSKSPQCKDFLLFYSDKIIPSCRENE